MYSPAVGERDFWPYDDWNCEGNYIQGCPYDKTDDFAECKRLCMLTASCGGIDRNDYWGTASLQDRNCTRQHGKSEWTHTLIERKNFNTGE